MKILGILLGLCLIFLFLIFVVFLYCAVLINKNIENNERKSESDENKMQKM